jgi:hypothetical protein
VWIVTLNFARDGGCELRLFITFALLTTSNENKKVIMKYIPKCSQNENQVCVWYVYNLQEIQRDKGYRKLTQ